MATKQKLETQLTEVQTKLDAAEAKLAELAKQPAVQGALVVTDVSSDQIEQLKKDFEARLALSESEKTELIDDVETLSKTLSALNDGLLIQSTEIETLKKKLAEKPTNLVKIENVIPAGHVSLDGVLHQVLKQERVADLCEQWKKRFVDDNDIVLLVKKA